MGMSDLQFKAYINSVLQDLLRIQKQLPEPNEDLENLIEQIRLAMNS
jgi:hypothetical protein